MRIAIVTAALALIACGGGGGGHKDTYDPITHVTDASFIPGGLGGEAHWGDAGTSIVVLDVFDPDYKALLLAHEVWHLFTRDSSHPNPCGCVSHSPPACEGEDLLTEPCQQEIEQVAASGRTVILSFPDDRDCAVAVSYFWNDALGYPAVLVVD